MKKLERKLSVLVDVVGSWLANESFKKELKAKQKELGFSMEELQNSLVDYEFDFKQEWKDAKEEIERREGRL